MPKTKTSKKNIVDHVTPSRRKNLDHMKLFFSLPEVEEIVAVARKVLKLPDVNFNSEKNISDKVLGWYGETYRRSNESQQLHAKARKERAEKGEITESMAQKQIDLLCTQLPENYLTSIVDRIAETYHLPDPFKDSIRTYIVSGVVSAPAFSFSMVSHYEGLAVEDAPKSAVPEFWAKPSNDDFKMLKLWLSGLAGAQLAENYKPIKNIDKKLRIEEMKRDKIVTNELTRKTYALTAKDIAEAVGDEFGEKTTVGEVNEAPRELKDHRDKRWKNKIGK